MKYSVVILVAMLYGMSGCSSQKKLVKQAPFTVEKPSCTSFVGGREASGSGFVLRLPVVMQTDTKITFEKVYFRGHILDAEWETEDGKQIVQCRYERKPSDKKDFIMHDDPVMEVGNQPPGEIKDKEDFPFELKPDEAVIAYTHNGKIRYTKISGVKDKSPEILPGRENN